MSSSEQVSTDNDEFKVRRESNKILKKMQRSVSESSMLSAEVCMTPDRCKKTKEFEDSTLYSKVRESLNKVNRVSKSSLPVPSTPSKPGVYVETCIGKFAQIKSLFDRRCRGTAERSPRSRPNGARDSAKIVNTILRKFKQNMSSTGEPRRRRLYESESSTPERVTFDPRKETVKILDNVF